MNHNPPFLKTGNKIAIAATARKIAAEEIESAISIFKSWGLDVVINESLFESENQFAGNDLIRTKNLQSYLDDKNISAIVCARGGYGTVRIIDKLDFSGFNKNPKWICGYSDITVLHSHLLTHSHLQTLHCTMPINMQEGKEDEESIASMKNALFGQQLHYQVSPNPLNKSGEANAALVGGNLSVLYSLLGSSSDIDTNGKILFLEDLDEYLYHIDRMMLNMKRNGKLSNLKGLIVGGMSDMKDNAIPFGKTAEEIICDHVKEFDYPVCFGFPAGHEKKNLAMKFGAEISFTVNDEGCSITFS